MLGRLSNLSRSLFKFNKKKILLYLSRLICGSGIGMFKYLSNSSKSLSVSPKSSSLIKIKIKFLSICGSGIYTSKSLSHSSKSPFVWPKSSLLIKFPIKFSKSMIDKSASLICSNELSMPRS